MFAWKRKTKPDVTQHPYATATSPDQIIAEAMKVSMAKDITLWGRYHMQRGGKRIGADRFYGSHLGDHELSNQDHSLHLTWSTRPSGYDYEDVNFKVNDIEFDEKVARDILDSYNRLKAAYDKAQATAAKAKLAMEANENKWNLAESLLGLTRNDAGALVPIEPAG